MMGAGKTAVGQAVAAELGVPFRDSDEEIVTAAARSIAEIFERDGEAFFRDRETMVIRRLLEGPPCILSTGGGAFLNAGNRAMISQKGISLWLSADLELLWARVRHKTTRPLLMTEDPKATLAKIYEARVPVYELADVRVETDASYSIAQTAQCVIDGLGERSDVLEVSR